MMQPITFPLDRDQIRERAYYLWEERGRPGGCDMEDWLAAERELVAELLAADNGDTIPLAVESHRQDAAFGLEPLTEGEQIKRRCTRVELADGTNSKQIYELVELQGDAARYGLLEADTRRERRLRYGLVELPPRR